MAVQTVEVTITPEWVKVADGACIVQSVNDREAFDKLFFDLVIGGAKPASDTTTFLRITLFEHANFYPEATVWLRLNRKNADKDQPVVVVKEVA